MGDSKSVAGEGRLRVAGRSSLAGRPRILLAEDDPVSREFLAAALRELGCEVVAVADGHAAAEATFTGQFDLLILDHRMPGLDGSRVLEITRANPYGAANQDSPAIATTADPDPKLHQWLRDAARFDGVLLKPASKAQLHDALLQFGLMKHAADRAIMDDEAGIKASGNLQALTALRGLFARELDALANEWNRLRDDGDALSERLHKLRAACGFCGASALKAAGEKLSDALRGTDPVRIEECRAEFQQALAATRAALNGP